MPQTTGSGKAAAATWRRAAWRQWPSPARSTELRLLRAERPSPRPRPGQVRPRAGGMPGPRMVYDVTRCRGSPRVFPDGTFEYLVPQVPVSELKPTVNTRAPTAFSINADTLSTSLTDNYSAESSTP